MSAATKSETIKLLHLVYIIYLFTSVSKIQDLGIFLSYYNDKIIANSVRLCTY